MRESTTRHAATTPPPTRWCRQFPATPEQVRQARRFLAHGLDGLPLTDDALLCLSEVASNAILHSASSRPGGQFTVRVDLDPHRLRVEVHDDGGPWGHDDPGDTHGRGLVIVAALSRAWGVTGDGPEPKTVWFEIGRP
jgi:anti-sigma regulatory factor (Ser/Thr protein kinase)